MLLFRKVASISCLSNFNFCSRIFRDVPSDITLEVSGTTFSLHKVTFLLYYSYYNLVHMEEKKKEVL